MAKHRMQILLKPECLEEEIKRDLQATLAPAEPEIRIASEVLLQANRTSGDEFRKEAVEENSLWAMENGLLLYHNRLMVPG
jgi:hypothetical protein